MYSVSYSFGFLTHSYELKNHYMASSQKNTNLQIRKLKQENQELKKKLMDCLPPLEIKENNTGNTQIPNYSTPRAIRPITPSSASKSVFDFEVFESFFNKK